MANPEIQPDKTPNTEPVPAQPEKDRSFQPPKPDVEINPAGPGNDTEVDLDTEKIETYPDRDAPDRNH